MRVEFARAGGRRDAIAVAPGELLVDAAERAGVSVPFGCKTGACSTCVGKLRRGAVDHVRPPRALKERHLDDGYVLPCIATPTADCLLEVGPAIQAELLENPWR